MKVSAQLLAPVALSPLDSKLGDFPGQSRRGPDRNISTLAWNRNQIVQPDIHFSYHPIGAGIAQSVQRLATTWTTGFDSRRGR
jgi:hypothetical protein